MPGFCKSYIEGDTTNMTSQSTKGSSTRVSRVIKAERNVVYSAFLDPDSVAAWLAPNSMTGHVHVFEPREGGRFRMSLTYRNADHPVAGKTSADTDTVQGRFVELVPNKKIVEVVEFESQDPAFSGEMKILVSLTDAEVPKSLLSATTFPQEFGRKTTNRAARNLLRSWLNSWNDHPGSLPFHAL
jgi:uncharacterized protein YndB with AHSA1/START domain